MKSRSGSAQEPLFFLRSISGAVRAGRVEVRRGGSVSGGVVANEAVVQGKVRGGVQAPQQEVEADDREDDDEHDAGTQTIRWRGTIPPQKWMNFYTKVLASSPKVREKFKDTDFVRQKRALTASFHHGRFLTR